MKKRITRCLALLLAVVMVLSVMPAAMAEETAQTATLVTDASTLKVGDEIVIAAKARTMRWEQTRRQITAQQLRLQKTAIS